MLWQGVTLVWALMVVAAFAVYGILVIAWQLWGWLVKYHEQGKSVYFIIVTENAERDIEMVLRRIHHKCLSIEYPTYVCLVDAGSTDLTVAIAERMARKGLPLDILRAQTLDEALTIAGGYGESAGSIRCIYQVKRDEGLTTIVR